MGDLSKLPNIGVKLEKQLFDVGITTVEELRSVGSREVWLRILQRDPSACIMRLSALEGAIQGIRWHNLDSDTKESLKEFYHKHKSAIK
ncbi:TfoX/Sxy family protein [Acetivibrio mesophilus]|uniref:Competence protein TfoX n=1 Tax=Acetivibrio mesophilus TaxID=2487273 RepID=A0A4Q0I3W5_9FIRM|nr:TfoX/Sxy family protein [Acetivibrio mesophilus]ODM26623.1 competence protein TfoX [Clostridium sp. Bc-iso-3]RXE58946.1 competence protein TfoX [Acetivibrio mesophilus]